MYAWHVVQLWLAGCDSQLYVMLTTSSLLRKLCRQLGVHMLVLLMCRLVGRLGKFTVQELC
jgi:hypothetical protein